MAMAAKLLADAGYRLKDGVLTNAAGVQLKVEFLTRPARLRAPHPALHRRSCRGSASRPACAPWTARNIVARVDKFDFDIIIAHLPAVAVTRQRAARLVGLGSRRQGGQRQRHRDQEPGRRQADRQDHPGQGPRRSRRRHTSARPCAALEPLRRAAMAYAVRAGRHVECVRAAEQLPRATVVPAASGGGTTPRPSRRPRHAASVRRAGNDARNLDDAVPEPHLQAGDRRGAAAECRSSAARRR